MFMDSFVRRFIKASLIWLTAGVTLGLLMVLWPRAIVYRAAHMHANLLGFVSMMIFGVAYHVLPRFTGRPLHSPTLAAAHVWLANGGLVLMVTGWILRAHVAFWPPVLATGALLAAVGAFFFVYNCWRTLDGAGVLSTTPQPISIRRSGAP
jgi:cbb3-type cytochrome oxidase subunit 1